MSKKLLLLLSMIALAGLSAAGAHRITIFQDSQIGGKKVKAGDYRIELKDDAVRLEHGKQVIETPAKVDSTGEKYRSTMIVYMAGTEQIQEIRFGGTNTKVTFSAGKMSAAN